MLPTPPAPPLILGIRTMNSVVPIMGSNFLVSLAADIRLHHEAVEQSGQSKLEHSIQAGKALNEAKALLKQTGGSWAKWLEINFQFTQRTATKYMKLAIHAQKIGTSGSDRSIRSALKLVAASGDIAGPPSRPKATRTISADHKDAIRAATTGRIKAKRRKPNSEPIKQNFIPNIPGYLEEMLLTMERCVVEYEITPVEATAKAIIAHRIKVEHFDEIIDWLTRLKHTVHRTPLEDGHEQKT